MTVEQRRERQKEALRRKILDAAGEMFATEGFEAVSMRKLADKIEYSPTTIYLYFQDKAELLGCLCEETFTGLVQVLAGIERKSREPVAGLEKGLRAYVDFGLQHPHHYVVTFVMPRCDVREPSEFDGSVGETAFDYLRRAVERCIREKKFRRVDAETASQVLWAGVHGITSLLITQTRFPWRDREKLIKQTISALIRGFLKTNKK